MRKNPRTVEIARARVKGRWLLANVLREDACVRPSSQGTNRIGLLLADAAAEADDAAFAGLERGDDLPTQDQRILFVVFRKEVRIAARF